MTNDDYAREDAAGMLVRRPVDTEVLGMDASDGYDIPLAVGERPDRGCDGCEWQTVTRSDPEDLLQLAEVLKRARIGFWSVSEDRRRVTWSAEVYALIDRPPASYAASFRHMIECLHPDDRHILRDLEPAGTPWKDGLRAEARLIRPDGQTIHVAIEAWPTAPGPSGGGMRGYIQDISRRKEAELALVRSEKLAILGHLAGGIAHDFNNLLTVVSLNLEEAIAELPAGHDLQDILVPALQAAQRGADLTSQLLSYSRQAPLRSQATTLPNFFTTCRPLLQRAIGSKRTLHVSIGDHSCKPSVDRAQLQTALLNLVLNARDASAEGTAITVCADSVSLPDRRYDLPDADPGRYAMLSVADEGCGMSQEVLANAFTPFFTTKTESASSGLGLSMVEGFVRQSRGGVDIDSAVGRGTTIRMFLPIEAPDADDSMIGVTARKRPTALIVDDEPAVLATVSRMFAQLGYDVRAVADASAALLELDTGRRFDLLFSDVVLGGELSGIDLCRIVRRRYPSVRILLTSGFSEHAATASAIGDTGVLLKPYRRQELFDRLSKLLPNRDDRPEAAASLLELVRGEACGSDAWT